MFFVRNLNVRTLMNDVCDCIELMTLRRTKFVEKEKEKKEMFFEQRNLNVRTLMNDVCDYIELLIGYDETFRHETKIESWENNSQTEFTMSGHQKIKEIMKSFGTF